MTNSLAPSTFKPEPMPPYEKTGEARANILCSVSTLRDLQTGPISCLSIEDNLSIVDVAVIGSGIHGTLAAYELLANRPLKKGVIIEESGLVGGVFGRLEQSYELANPIYLPTTGENFRTCGQVVNFIETALLKANIPALLNTRVLDIQRGDKNGPRYKIVLDSGKTIQANIVICATGYEIIRTSRFDPLTQSLLQNPPANIQSVDRLTINLARSHSARFQKTHQFELNAPRVALIGGGQSAEYANSLLMRSNLALSSTIFWITGSPNATRKPKLGASNNGEACTSVLDIVPGYAHKISLNDKGNFSVMVTDDLRRVNVLEDIGFICLATGFEKNLTNKICESLGALPFDVDLESPTQLESKAGKENIFLIGAAISFSPVQMLFPNTLLTAKHVSKLF